MLVPKIIGQRSVSLAKYAQTATKAESDSLRFRRLFDSCVLPPRRFEARVLAPATMCPSKLRAAVAVFLGISKPAIMARAMHDPSAGSGDAAHLPKDTGCFGACKSDTEIASIRNGLAEELDQGGREFKK